MEVNGSKDGGETPTPNSDDIPVAVKKEKTTAIAKQDVKAPVRNDLTDLNLFDAKELAAAKNFLTEIMRSDKGGIKSVNEGLAVLMRAKDLNLPFSTSIEHIHVINGKTGIDIHIIKALLTRAGCTWECTQDYQPLYEYTDGFNVYVDGAFPEYVKRCKNEAEASALAEKNPDDDFVYVYPVKWYKDFNGNAYKDYQLNANFKIALNKQQASIIIKEGKTPVYRVPHQAVDYVTEYVISRLVMGKEVKSTGRFTYSDAVAAEMFEKDTYKKYPKVLIGHRAFTYAARDIASDVLFGCMETTELKIITDTNINDNDIEYAEAISID